jgi:transaldolase
MKLFIDAADVREIRQCHEQGIIAGVTTNPSLLAKAAVASGTTFGDILAEICEIVKGPVSAEVVAQDHDGMMREAHELAKIAPNIVVSAPLTTEGLKAVRACAAEGIKTNVTQCFSPVQALLAAKAGAGYISPLVGRLDDVASEGMDLVRKIVATYRNYGFPTQVLVASARNPNHVVEAALCGAHVATIPFTVLQQLVKRPLTDVGLARFPADKNKQAAK